MYFSTIAATFSFIIALAYSAPLTARDDREYACPAGQYYRAPHQCPTGFYGCVAYNEGAVACYNDWEPVPRKINPLIDGSCNVNEISFGNFISCSSENKLLFSGCAKGVGCEFWLSAVPTTEPVVVAAPPSGEPAKPVSGTWNCALGATFYPSACASGFTGCTDEKSTVCDAGTVRYGNGSCPPGYNWLVCKGVSGCAKGDSVCN
jgi:hypothetical protein